MGRSTVHLLLVVAVVSLIVSLVLELRALPRQPPGLRRHELLRPEVTPCQHQPAVLYGLVAAWVVFQARQDNLLMQASEPMGGDLLSARAAGQVGFSPASAYPLSILTQSFLFFKYLSLWILPVPQWMSVDMREPFAHTGWSVPMPVAFSVLPLMFQRLSATRAVMIPTVLALAMIPATWNRLTTFSHPFLLWNDAARLVQGHDDRPGAERIYGNRGAELFKLRQVQAALKDYDKSIALLPRKQVYRNRGNLYLGTSQYSLAVRDFTLALELDPTFTDAYLGRATANEALPDLDAARGDYFLLCTLGSAIGCQKLASLPAAVPPER